MNDASPLEAGHFCSSVMNVFANRYSFQPSKNVITAAAAIEGGISGGMFWGGIASLGQPSTRADSSISSDTPSIALLRIHTATGMAKAVSLSTKPVRLSSSPKVRKIE